MPRAKGTALRLSIIEGRQKGKTLMELSLEHHVSYGTVQSFCARFSAKGELGLKPFYDHCGKRKPGPTDFVFRLVRCFKTWHPTWGAEKIRTELLLRRPGLLIPSVRTLQQWFHQNGQAKRRIKQPRMPRQWANFPHEGWQIDAKEEMQTQDGVKNCWLNIKDEHSGAVIAPPVFPL